jgi:diguanylate cyclase
MTSAHNSSATSTDEAPLLENALEKNREVKGKVENCAAELSTVNDTVKKRMMAGLTLLPAEKVLAKSESVEDKVQEMRRRTS